MNRCTCSRTKASKCSQVRLDRASGCVFFCSIGGASFSCRASARWVWSPEKIHRLSFISTLLGYTSSPDFMIPGPYNVTFKDSSTDPVPISTLQDQIQRKSLDRFERIAGLGGREYRAIVEE